MFAASGCASVQVLALFFMWKTMLRACLCNAAAPWKQFSKREGETCMFSVESKNSLKFRVSKEIKVPLNEYDLCRVEMAPHKCVLNESLDPLTPVLVPRWFSLSWGMITM